MVSGHLTPKIVLRQRFRKTWKCFDRRCCFCPCFRAVGRSWLRRRYMYVISSLPRYAAPGHQSWGNGKTNTQHDMRRTPLHTNKTWSLSQTTGGNGEPNIATDITTHKKQELLTLREHQVSSQFFGGVPVAHLFMGFFVLSYYVSLRSEFRVVMSVAMFGLVRLFLLESE
jgi:hypothetical protein